MIAKSKLRLRLPFWGEGQWSWAKWRRRSCSCTQRDRETLFPWRTEGRLFCSFLRRYISPFSKPFTCPAALLLSSSFELGAVQEVLFAFWGSRKWLRWQMLAQKCLWTKFQTFAPWTLARRHEFFWMLPANRPSPLKLCRHFDSLRDAVG